MNTIDEHYAPPGFIAKPLKFSDILGITCEGCFFEFADVKGCRLVDHDHIRHLSAQTTHTLFLSKTTTNMLIIIAISVLFLIPFRIMGATWVEAVGQLVSIWAILFLIWLAYVALAA